MVFQGYLDKKAPTPIFNKWDVRWFVLRPSTLQYYRQRDEKELCGTIKITNHCRVGVSTPKDMLLNTVTFTSMLKTCIKFRLFYHLNLTRCFIL